MTNEKPIGSLFDIDRMSILFRNSKPTRITYKRHAFDFLCWCRYKGNPFNPTKEMAVEYTETMKRYCDDYESKRRGIVANDVVRWANSED